MVSRDLVQWTVLAVAAVVLAGQAQAQVTAEQIDQAIGRAADWLWQQQQPDGMWPYRDPNRPEEHVLATLAMEVADAPLDDPRFAKAMAHLLQMDIDFSYIRSARLMTLAHQYHRLPREKQPLIQKAMAVDAEWLFGAQSSGGGWRYNRRPPRPQNVDVSATGFAITALAEAARCGLRLPKNTMPLAHKQMLVFQRPDGGWNYGARNQLDKQLPYGSMTASGMASLLLTTELLVADASGCPCSGGHSRRSAAVPTKAIQSGLAWLGNRFKPNENPGKGNDRFFYWLYQIERVGLATGLRHFGSNDWYARGAAELIRRQDNKSGKIGNIQDTSFALVFLVRGRKTLLLNRLATDDDVNPFRKDLEHLTGYVRQATGRSADWQVVGVDDPLSAWHEAPIVHVPAESAFKMTDEQKRKLREFTDTGGTILLEARCNATAGKTFLERLAGDLWPEQALKPVDNNHPLWTAAEGIRGPKPKLQHIDDGVRSAVFFSPRDLSCVWHSLAVTRNRNLFDLGRNLAAYVTDRGHLRRRLADPAVPAAAKYANQKLVPGKRKELAVARVRHGDEWDAGRNYRPWQHLAAGPLARTGLKLAVRDPVAAGQPVPEGTDLVYLTGRAACDLGDGGAAWLKQVAANSAFLFIESAAGDPRFDESARALMAGAGFLLTPFGPESPLVTGKLFDASGYAIKDVACSRTLTEERAARAADQPPEPLPLLYGIYADKKLVGIYSPYDILFSQTSYKAFGNRGYAPADARAIATNILLLVSVK